MVAVDTESAEFGVAPLIVRFAFGSDGGPTSLIAATDASALGHPQVAARWGDLFRDVIWAAIARLVAARLRRRCPRRAHGAARRARDQPCSRPFSAVDLAVAHVRDLVDERCAAGDAARPGRTGPTAPTRRPGGPS